MKLEAAIVRRLELAGKGVPGTNLFHSHMPAQVPVGTLVLTRVAILRDPYSGLRKGQFQVVCRGVSAEAVHAMAVEALEALRGEQVMVGNVNFLFIFPLHEPIVFPRTDGSQYEASVNYQFSAYWE